MIYVYIGFFVTSTNNTICIAEGGYQQYLLYVGHINISMLYMPVVTTFDTRIRLGVHYSGTKRTFCIILFTVLTNFLDLKSDLENNKHK